MLYNKILVSVFLGELRGRWSQSGSPPGVGGNPPPGRASEIHAGCRLPRPEPTAGVRRSRGPVSPTPRTLLQLCGKE